MPGGWPRARPVDQGWVSRHRRELRPSAAPQLARGRRTVPGADEAVRRPAVDAPAGLHEQLLLLEPALQALAAVALWQPPCPPSPVRRQVFAAWALKASTSST